MSDQVMIRCEQTDDESGIRAVHLASFPGPAEARVVDGLRQAGSLTISIVCAQGSLIVGHAAFSLVTPEHGPAGLGLAPVAVLAAHRRQGIAAQVIRAGLDLARATGSSWVAVLGDPAYYGRFGFMPASRHGMSDEYGGGACFQVMPLIPGGMPAGGGLVRFSPEFARCGC